MATKAKKLKLLFLGLDNAGKTTLLHLLKDPVSTPSPSLSPSSSDVSLGDRQVQIVDVGGHVRSRKLWSSYYPHSDGIVFVVDAADAGRFSEACQELQQIMKAVRKAPILVLANKNDASGAQNEASIKRALQLEQMTTGKTSTTRRRRPLEVFCCSCLQKTGYHEGFKWLLANLPEPRPALELDEKLVEDVFLTLESLANDSEMLSELLPIILPVLAEVSRTMTGGNKPTGREKETLPVVSVMHRFPDMKQTLLSYLPDVLTGQLGPAELVANLTTEHPEILAEIESRKKAVPDLILNGHASAAALSHPRMPELVKGLLSVVVRLFRFRDQFGVMKHLKDMMNRQPPQGLPELAKQASDTPELLEGFVDLVFIASELLDILIIACQQQAASPAPPVDNKPIPEMATVEFLGPIPQRPDDPSSNGNIIMYTVLQAVDALFANQKLVDFLLSKLIRMVVRLSESPMFLSIVMGPPATVRVIAQWARLDISDRSRLQDLLRDAAKQVIHEGPSNVERIIDAAVNTVITKWHPVADSELPPVCAPAKAAVFWAHLTREIQPYIPMLACTVASIIPKIGFFARIAKIILTKDVILRQVSPVIIIPHVADRFPVTVNVLSDAIMDIAHAANIVYGPVSRALRLVDEGATSLAAAPAAGDSLSEKFESFRAWLRSQENSACLDIFLNQAVVCNAMLSTVMQSFLQTQKLMGELSEKEQTQSKINQILQAQQSRVTVDVCGVLYQTSRTTLAGSADTSSFFKKHFQQSTTNQVLEIDRNGERFWHVLSYLRSGDPMLPVGDMMALHYIKKEAEFFGLENLLKIVDGHTQPSQQQQQQPGSVAIGQPLEPLRQLYQPATYESSVQWWVRNSRPRPTAAAAGPEPTAEQPERFIAQITSEAERIRALQQHATTVQTVVEEYKQQLKQRYSDACAAAQPSLPPANAAQFSGRVKLNVGGKQFPVSINTLTRVDSVLSELFSGRYPVIADSDGAYFIDRDGEVFQFILDYLRDGDVYKPEDELLLKRLRCETRFYGLTELLKIIDPAAGTPAAAPQKDPHLSA